MADRRYHLPDMPRTALVTGAGKRVGRAIALALGEAGWSVAVHYNGSRDAAEEVAEMVRAAGAESCTVQADLGREAEVVGLVDAAAAGIGPLGCLVNNASVFEFDEALTATRENWDLHMEVNLRAPFVLTQALARQVPDGMRGHVINIIDQRVLNQTPYFTSYSASKFALWGMTQQLALALGPLVQVNGIGPGPTLKGANQSQEQFDRQNREVPLGHGAEPWEIADTVLFLLASASITGTLIPVDGGQHHGWAQPGQEINPTD